MADNLFLLEIAALVLSAACAPVSGDALPSRCEAIEIDPMRELVVTDPAVVTDARGNYERIMGAVLGAQSIDLTGASFELVAIANRVDLATLGPGHSAELRFVYGQVASGVRKPLTMAVELRLPPTRTVQGWAAAWHALGSLTGDANREALFAIVDQVLADPLQGQVRTQDARGPLPTLLEFDFAEGSPPVPSALFNQPATDVRPRELAAFVAAHEDEIVAGEEIVPRSMLAFFATATPPAFPLAGVLPELATAFANTTCSGCHTSEPTLDGTFHISPMRRGQQALSPFLVGAGGRPAELSRRAEILRGLLCQD
jgi:hypothetical protein